MKLFKTELTPPLAAISACLFAVSAQAFTHSSVITAAGYTGTETLKNFPVLVKIDATHVPGFSYDLCRDDGRDISFTSVDGLTKYSYEVDTWNPGGTSLVWVKIPELTAATQFRFSFGDKTNDPPAVGDREKEVWSDANDGFYAGVWHMSESAPTGAEKSPDSAKHGDIDLDAVPKADGYNGGSTTPAGDVSRMVSVNGLIGRARRIDDTARNYGQSFMLNTTTDYALGQNVTFSFWTKANAAISGERPIICRSCRANSGYAFNIYASTSTELIVQGGNNTKATATIPDLTTGWHHIVAVCRGAVADVYADGVCVLTGQKIGTIGDGDRTYAPYMQFGNWVGNSGSNYPGDLDEVRMLKTAVSADWVKAEYDTVATDGFLAAEEAVEGEIVDSDWTSEPHLYPVKVAATASDAVITIDGAAVAQGVVNLTLGAHTVAVSGGGDFIGWAGALAGATSTTATFTLGEEGAFIAAITTGGTAGTITWTATEEGEWYDAANWDLGRIPGAGDAVVLPSGAKVRLDAPTPALASLTVASGATLVPRNWFTKIDGGAVTVSGTVKLGGYFFDDTMSNRVWIAGTTLTVPAGGRISADAAGYAGRNGPAWVGATHLNHHFTSKGYGTSKFGGAYGGDQGYDDTEHHVNNVRHANYIAPHTYGSAEWPFDPGSGGGPEYAAAGGAVYLDFSGAVTVDGEITADSNTMTYQWDDFLPGNGSGGGIVIKCASIAGAGKVSASGLSTLVYSNGKWQQSGVSSANSFGGNGGGRIAVHYDAGSQASADCRISFEARGSCGGKQTIRHIHCGSVGSLWFTDDQFLTTSDYYKENGWKFIGSWHSGTLGNSLTIPHDVVANGGPCFPYSGFRLAFEGDLTVNGTGNSRSTLFGPSDGSYIDHGIGDVVMTVAGNLTLNGARLDVRRGNLTVGGDFTMADAADAGSGAEFRLYAAQTNGTEKLYGAEAVVGGAWTLGKQTLAMAYCDQEKGAIPHFTVEDLTVADTAKIDASEKGYLNGKGPAVGSNNCGSSHGGHGGRNNTTAAIPPTYDSLKRPCMPGSGGPSGSWFYGGGVVYIEASRNMTIHGTIAADANRDTDTRSGGGEAKPGSGGTVRLTAGRFLCDGYVTAKGTAIYAGVAGGGGRIAIWTAINKSPELEDLTSDYSMTHVDVRATSPGEPGTVYFGKIRGSMILVR